MRISCNVGLMLLLLYSLSPGIAKLIEIPWVAIFGYFFLYLFFVYEQKKIITFDKSKIIHIIFFLIIIFYTAIIVFIYSIFNIIEFESMYFGAATFLIPIFFASICTRSTYEIIVNSIPTIALIHGIIAICIYPEGPIAPYFLHISEKLYSGVMAFRFSSVSGSLAFSGLMISGLVCLIFRKNFPRQLNAAQLLLALFFIFCILMSLQRAAWLSCFLIIFYWLIKNRKIINNPKFIFICLLPIIIIINSEIFSDHVYFDLVYDRISSIASIGENSPIIERAGQWKNVFNNLNEMPFGSGPGQIGQAARELESRNGLMPIPDGDYFRIASEYGPIGIAIVLWIVIACIKSLGFLLIKNINNQFFIKPILVIAFSIQMLGTNVTEIYFVNFIFLATLFNLGINDKIMHISKP